ncbi:uncharacterized protein LOC127794702 [Diospyros lotus]|uniref:uncharacterized protein LOC127794702 n=1 Tax=Diospyros lotus TaxID=55363 RepID=UPI0022504561|nr:uncharacterized protein LOC127794702 [Diospyros lotus]
MASKGVLAVAFVLDVAASALAVAAEQKRTKMLTYYEDQTGTHCIYDTDIATGLGVGSFLSLVATQILIMVASGCLCCGKALRQGASRTWAIVLFISSWVTFLIAGACLLAGAAGNYHHTKIRHPPCERLKGGIFAAGAAFILFSTTASKLYYVCYSKAKIDGFESDNSAGLGENTLCSFLIKRGRLEAGSQRQGPGFGDESVRRAADTCKHSDTQICGMCRRCSSTIFIKIPFGPRFPRFVSNRKNEVGVGVSVNLARGMASAYGKKDIKEEMDMFRKERGKAALGSIPADKAAGRAFVALVLTAPTA